MNELTKALNEYSTKAKEKFDIQERVNNLLIRSGYNAFRVQDNMYVTNLNIWLDATDPSTDKLYNFPVNSDTLEILGKGLSESEVFGLLIEAEKGLYVSDTPFGE